jgi:CheY-like chemotaxis protein
MLLKEKHVFVIEDNLENRIILRIALTRQGASVEFERWGRDLRSHLDAVKDIDVILLDLMFPNGISGYDIIKEIRQIPSLGMVPIVAVSAADPCTAIPRCRASGFAGFIAKPLDDELFPSQVADIIAGRSVWYAG